MVQPLIVADPPAPADVPPHATKPIQAPTSLIPPLVHPMTTRLRDDIVKQRVCIDDTIKYHLPRALFTALDSITPTYYTEASK